MLGGNGDDDGNDGDEEWMWSKVDKNILVGERGRDERMYLIRMGADRIGLGRRAVRRSNVSMLVHEVRWSHSRHRTRLR